MILLILGFVIRIVTPKFGHGDGMKSAAEWQVEAFALPLENLRRDTGLYPVGTNGLQALLFRPEGITNWHGPYLVDRNGSELQQLPIDPWQQAYIYECPGKHVASGYPYDLFSLGRPGENKPIANWQNPSLKR